MTKKIKNEEMDIVFLLDRSGSMGGIETDTIGGYNSYIKEQKKNNVKENLLILLALVITSLTIGYLTCLIILLLKK